MISFQRALPPVTRPMMTMAELEMLLRRGIQVERAASSCSQGKPVVER